MSLELDIRTAIQRLEVSIQETALGAGRDPGSIRYVLISKTVSEEQIREAYEAGARDFGESRAQNLVEKKRQMPIDIKWHMIGHLQTNKVKLVAGETALIHSLDSLELAQEIDSQAELKKIDRVPCLIQVNSSGEATKSGMLPEEAEAFADQVKNLKTRLHGMMTIGPNTTDENKIREAFRTTADVFKRLACKFPADQWNILSMGMSGDYKIAIEEGSNLLRIGSAVFGERKK